MHSRWAFKALALALALGQLLAPPHVAAAAAASAGRGRIPASAGGAGRTLQVAGGVGGDLSADWLERVAEAFEQETPGMTVIFPYASTAEATTDVQKARSKADIIGGKLDVVAVDGIYQLELAEHLVSFPKSELSPDLLSAFDQEAFAHFEPEGGMIQSFPYYDDVGFLFYRTDLLKRYNFSAPGPEGWTWDQVEHIARTVQEAELALCSKQQSCTFKGFVWQGAPYEGLTCVASEIVAAEGGGPFVSDSGEVSLSTDPGVKRALERMLNWVNPSDGRAAISPMQVFTMAEDDVTRSFCTVADSMFARAWSGMLGQCNKQGMGGLISAVRMPSAKAPGRGTWGGVGLAVANDSKNKAEAKRFIEIALSHRWQVWQFEATRRLPMRREMLQNASLCADQPREFCRVDIQSLLNDTLVRAPGNSELKTNIVRAPSSDCPEVDKILTPCDMRTELNRTEGYAVERPAKITGRKYDMMSSMFFEAVHDILKHDQRNETLRERLHDAECRMVGATSEDGDKMLRVGAGIQCGLLGKPAEECRFFWLGNWCVPAVLYICALPLILIAVIITHVYLLRVVRKKANSGWLIDLSDIVFSDPEDVLGHGTFGRVLKAEWCGTDVAVKRVLPPGGFVSFPAFGDPLLDRRMRSMASSSRSSNLPSGDFVGLEVGDEEVRTEPLGWMTPGCHTTISRKMSQRTRLSAYTTTFSPAQLRLDFIEEMRLLIKLRHPCILAVMGAVIPNKMEPMLVMELMHHGSLHELLRNETMDFDGEVMLPILRDIIQGLRFLHAMRPQVVHGGLNTKNVLVDSKSRAKVADFGFSQKRKAGMVPSSLWIAPELQEQQQPVCTAATDVFAFGILLIEVSTRNEPEMVADFGEVGDSVSPGSGLHLQPQAPGSCTPSISMLMRECWREDPALRPPASEIDRRLQVMDVGDVDSGPIRKRRSDGRKRTYDLLLDVFPAHIAAALHEGRPIEPEHRDCVTIFFSDIVGFTDISSALEPQKVSDMLGRLYSKFDELSRELRVFKVETIGDAYMAVANLVEDQLDHTKRIAEFARWAIRAANETLVDTEDPGRGYISIRVGFHSGPVVADVVGTRNLRYCLFGDTVNTASRMESNSAANQINCSAVAAELLMQQAPLTKMQARGAIPIKGKGEMHTFWVNVTPTEELVNFGDLLGVPRCSVTLS